jgi:hypothetical protein
MPSYQNSDEKSMVIFQTRTEARYYRQGDEVLIPYGSPYEEQRWVNVQKAEYIRSRYSVQFAH